MNFKVGNVVYWDDPDDGCCSAKGTVTRADRSADRYVVVTDDGSEIEAHSFELTFMYERKTCSSTP